VLIIELQLVRYNDDGTINFIGRRDAQIKIRGQRIELGEVEFHVKSQWKGGHIVVEVVKPVHRNGQEILTVFLSLGSGNDIDLDGGEIPQAISDELRSLMLEMEAHLQKVLPSYMVPSMFVPLKEVPVTVSGKTDRAKLRRWCAELSEQQILLFTMVDQHKREPSTDLERAFQQLWAQVLGRSPSSIGADDSFFRLGGDSITAIRLVAACRGQAISLEVFNIFNSPILSDMARVAKFLNGIPLNMGLQPYSLLPSPKVHDIIAEASLQCKVSPEIVEDIYPCTALQEGLMALSIRHSGSYIVRNVYRIPSTVDLDRFREAWDAVIEETPILRTRLALTDPAGLVQVVVRAKYTWQQGSELSDYLNADTGIPMSYGDFMARLTIIDNVDLNERYFIFTIHHAIYDGWSFPLILRRVEAAYQKQPMSDAPPFGHFIRHISTTDLAVTEQFWASTLEGVSCQQFPKLPSAAYHVKADKMLAKTMDLPKETIPGITKSTLIRAAWGILVSQYTGSDDTVFGATMSGRNAGVEGISSIIGPTITTIPVRLSLEREKTVSTYLEMVQQTSTDAMPHEHFGLQNISKVSIDAQAACDFQMLLVIQPEHDTNSSLDFLGLERMELKGADGFDTYGLSIECNLTPTSVTFHASYDSGLLSKEELQRMLNQLSHVLGQLQMPSAHRRLRDIEVITPQDIEQVMLWNSVEPPTNEVCLHQVFERQARTQSERPAICGWDGNYTYGTLNEAASTLAKELCHLGVGPEVLVPISFEKSTSAIVAMLAVMKAGGAYVPLDVSHPKDRRVEIIQQTKAKIVLTSELHADLWTDIEATALVVSATSMKTLQLLHSMTDWSSSEVTPLNTAYVMFTSGSSGKPKGVVIEHRAVNASLAGHGVDLGFDANTRTLQFGSYTFDLTVTEIFGTLLSGGCVCVPNESSRTSDITRFMRETEVNLALFTPSFIRMIRPEEVPHLKTLGLGGEACTQDCIDIWASKVHMINGYGPTECAIVSILHHITGASQDASTIGRAVSCVSWIADSRNTNLLAPIGAVGELLIEGPTLFREYLDDKLKTAAAIIENPPWLPPRKSQSALRRLYKTGDLVRYNPNGSINYISRKDTQVKVNGQRLELGEIEHLLSQNTIIQHALVVLPKSGPCKKRLVAVVSFRDGTENKEEKTNEILPVSMSTKSKTASRVSELRQFLAGKIPSYMIPSTWIVVESIPLTSSKKINRGVATSFVENMTQETHKMVLDLTTESEFGAASTVMERNIQRIWARVLNIPLEHIGIGQSFLNLGGDSISAMQVMAKARTEGIHLTMQDILQTKDLSTLAACAKSVAHLTMTALQDSHKPFHLAPIQQMYFNHVASYGDNHFNQSFLLKVAKRIERLEMERAIDAIVERHAMLRARFEFQQVDGQWMQSVLREIAGSYRYSYHELLDIDDMGTIATKTQSSLNIQVGPVFAVDHFVTGESTHIYLVAHHLVVDLVSWRVIIQDLEDILRQEQLSSYNPISFRNWCHLQAEFAAANLRPKQALPSSVPEADIRYWGMQERENFYGETFQDGFQLDASTTLVLLGNCLKSLRLEPVEIFLSTIIHSFRRTFSDRHTPTIFNESHGREPWNTEIDISQTVGWFTTMYPIHVEVIGNDLIETVRRTKDTRRKVPSNGWQYFVSRFLTPEGIDRFKDHAEVEVAFNYSGLFQQMEREGALLRQGSWSGQEPSDIGPRVRRIPLIEINAAVQGGKARLTFVYNRHMKHTERIRGWVKECETTLKEAAQLLTRMETEYTLSDFSLLDLTREDLKTFVTETLLLITPISNIEDVYPCSPMQQGILLNQAKTSGNYNIRVMWEVIKRSPTMDIDIECIHRAWRKVIRRHPILRTVFIEGKTGSGHYNQLVLKEYEPEIPHLLADDSAPTVMLAAQMPIESRGVTPRHRFATCSSPGGNFLCQLDINHALFDGASHAVLLRDFALAYEDKLSHGRGPLYSDFIRHVQSQPVGTSINHWKHYLSDLTPCYFPRLVANRSAERVLKSRVVEFDTPPETIIDFCAKSNVTPSNFFQTVWAIVLRCFVGTDDVCFGYLTSGRDAPVNGIADAIGAFINMLVCRVQFKEEITIRGILEETQHDFLRNLEHQFCSLGEIQHALRLGGESIFNTAMSFQRESSDSNEAESTTSFIVVEGHDPSEYDITVNIGVGDKTVGVSLTYWTSSITDVQMLSITKAFSRVVSEILKSPDGTVKDLSLSHREDEAQILKWNTTIPTAAQPCVHELFSTHARAFPCAPAISSWDGQLSYKELDDISSRLADYLTELGIGSEVIVPICFEKSLWAVVSILAILKAGAAYTSLDPAHPSARRQEILSQIDAKFVLSSKLHSKSFASISSLVIITVDGLNLDKIDMKQSHGQFARESFGTVTPPHYLGRFDDAAYIIFTSGSTGAPKGVLIENQSLSASVVAQGKALGFGPHSRVLQFASYTFDASLIEIMTTLVYGGCICVPADATRMGGEIFQFINDQKVNLTFLSPSFLKLISPNEVPGLRTLLVGGEPVPRDMVDLWKNSLDLIQVYGHTETTIICMASPVPATEESDPANIGKAFGSNITWIVDPKNHHNLVPVGAIGELMLEGPQLARHYFKDDKKTAAAFIKNPAWAEANTNSQGLSLDRRFYKTGDLVRYNTDGTINFIGRKDTQVKIRGLRIELGEVECHANSLWTAGHTVAEVITIPGRQNDKVLAIFLSLERLKEDEDFSDDIHLNGTDEIFSNVTESLKVSMLELEASLSKVLPTYMVPTMYIPLKHIPTATSGKTDRSRLRKLVLSDDQISAFSLTNNIKRLPSTKMEITLQSLWADILGIPKESIGADDSFFRLGGDSIMTIKLASIARELGIALEVVNIFKHPTLCEMALLTEQKSKVQVDELLPFALVENRADAMKEAVAQCHVNSEEVLDIYPCTAIQEGLMALSVVKAGTYVAQNVFRLPDSIDIDCFTTAWEEVINSTPILRTRVIHTNSGSLQVVLRKSSSWNYPNDLANYLQDDKNTPMEYGESLCRLALVRDDNCERHSYQTNYFVLTIHHALYDGWSLPLIFAAVKAAYDGQPRPIPAPFSTFCQYLKNSGRKASEDFWKSTLDGISCPAFPQLPYTTYRPRADAKLEYRIKLEHDLIRYSNVRFSALIRGAWALVISKYTASTEAIFGVTLAGRNAPIPGIMGIVGPTITTVPIRVHLKPGSRIDDYLNAIQTQATDMIPYEHFGLQNMKKLSLDAQAACEFQTLLVIQLESGESSGFLDLEYVESAASDFETFPLTVEFRISGDAISVEARFDPNIVDQAQMKRLLEQFHHVLRQLPIPGNSSRSIESIQVISPQDQEELLVWNRRHVPRAFSICLHDVFQRNAEAEPNRPAVCSWDCSFTYAELDALSSALAGHLISIGVGPEVLVPICFEKSAWTIVAIIGILKAGGAFVPLDAAHPVARREEIVQQVNARLILTSVEVCFASLSNP
jgi:amino acid adenylation domain-containing protein/non-ribosomal peptide synthase protein (TIGR01720 family)